MKRRAMRKIITNYVETKLSSHLHGTKSNKRHSCERNLVEFLFTLEAKHQKQESYASEKS